MGTLSLKSILARTVDRIAACKRRIGGKGVKNFEENRLQEAAVDTVDRGTRPVPVDRIVGSVGRYRDFDSRFRPRQHMPPERLIRIRKAMLEGRSLPPVKLYQIKDEYYVVDGNHRIAAARELKRPMINACILEFIPSRNTLENILYRERSDFIDRTGIADAPRLTEVGQFENLARQISRHQEHLGRQAGEAVTFQEAAADWRQSIYRPLRAVIEKGALAQLFPERTLDDLYAYISLHQWEQGRRRRYGIGIDRLIPRDMEAFREQMANKHEDGYPEMRREITIFILMNVKARSELKIVDKLFAEKEVREIHSVHGDVDIIVKVVLSRDLLSSDSEVISQFVHNRLRKLPGVISTQTLIPGYSKSKETPGAGS